MLYVKSVRIRNIFYPVMLSWIFSNSVMFRGTFHNRNNLIWRNNTFWRKLVNGLVSESKTFSRETRHVIPEEECNYLGDLGKIYRNQETPGSTGRVHISAFRKQFYIELISILDHGHLFCYPNNTWSFCSHKSLLRAARSWW